MCFKKNLPNIITSLRFVGTLIIVFLSPLTPMYFTVYTATGITDLFDGFIARKTNSTSAFGARLDSIADLCFYAVSIIKLMPILIKTLPHLIWCFVAVILLMRILSYIIAALKFHRFASHHTWLNKITGAFVFALPYFLVTGFSVYYCFVVCFIGLLSTAEDFYIHISTSKYDESIKSLLSLKT